MQSGGSDPRGEWARRLADQVAASLERFTAELAEHIAEIAEQAVREAVHRAMGDVRAGAASGVPSDVQAADSDVAATPPAASGAREAVAGSSPAQAETEPAPPQATAEVAVETGGALDGAAGGLAAAPITPAADTTPQPASPNIQRRAERYAKVMVQDLELYLKRDRPDVLAEARAKRNIMGLLQPDIDKCYKSFRERFPEDTGIPGDVVRQALVSILCEGDEEALGASH
jgi:hypothetical protein